MPPIRPGGQVGEDVAEHVLRHEHVEALRPLHEVKGLGVDVGPLAARYRDTRGATSSKTLRKKAKLLKMFALSTQVTCAAAVRTRPMRSGQAEGEVADALDAAPRHDQRVGRDLVVQDDAALAARRTVPRSARAG